MTPMLALTGHATALFVSGPPRVPRSVTCGLPIHKAACETVSPAWFADPVTQPRSLMPFPAPCVPPSASSGIILYVVCTFCEVSRAGATANAVSSAMPAKLVDIQNFMLPPCWFSFTSRGGMPVCSFSWAWPMRGSANQEHGIRGDFLEPVQQ